MAPIPPPSFSFAARLRQAFCLAAIIIPCLFSAAVADDEGHFYKDNTTVEKQGGLVSVSTAPDLHPGKPGAYAGFTFLKSESGLSTYSMDIYVSATDPFNVIGCTDDHGADLSCRLKNMDLVKKTGLYLISIQSILSRTYLDALRSKDTVLLTVATDGPAIKVKVSPALLRAFLRKVDETEK